MLKVGSHNNWEFEGFKVLTEARLLLNEGAPVPLTSKSFDTLVLLIANRDRVVTKDELLQSVWPDVAVEEGNLTQQIFLLRKALGETAQAPRYIVTVPGHGYRFTARVNVVSADPAAPRRGVSLRPTGLVALGVIALLAIVVGWRWMIGKTRVPLEFTRPAKLTESGKATHSAISRDGRYVAYIENDGDEFSLWVKRVGTEGKTPVVRRQPLELGHLSFNPDGEYVYFTRRSPDGAMFILYRVPALGGPVTPILDDVDSPVSFSPDGSQFVFQRGADPESHIVVAPAGGGTDWILAAERSPVAFSTYAPAWSPDGKMVAAGVFDRSKRSRSIVLLPVDGGSRRELFQSPGQLGRLRWLPNGSGLLTIIGDTIERRQFKGGPIWRIDYPGGRGERLTADLSNYDPCCLDISEDGRVADVVNTLVSDLYVAPADRREAVERVTSDRPVVTRHSWLDNRTIVYRDSSGRVNAVATDGNAFNLHSPDGDEGSGGISACGDGRHVVFSAGRNIWRASPNAGGAVKITDGFHDFNPACSHDGKWVFFASREPEHVSLWKVSIEGGERTPLGLTYSFDVLPSPSGRMIHYTTDALEVQDRSTTRAGAPVRQDRWVVISSRDRERLFAVDATGDGTIGVMTQWAPDESGLDYIATRNGVSNIWRLPLNRDQAKQITRFPTGRIFSFAWSPNGQWLSLAIGVSRSDVVLMSTK